ncbi:MAG: LuxR C-terminal-related transcriptional regulator [Pseudorhodoferax sp.]
MSFLSNLSIADRGRCFDVLTEVAQIRTHLDLVNWLRGGVQHFMPHDILVAAWGDFQRGAIGHDIVSPLRGVRTAQASMSALVSRLQELFASWSAGNRQPYVTPAERLNGVLGLHSTAPAMRSAMVHGLRDLRGEQDCLYVVLRREAIPEKTGAAAMAALLPHIDMAMRQAALPSMPITQGSACVAPAQITISRHGPDQAVPDNGMTGRELQIMQWVEMGKTNQEIGTILDISEFTVKNHLQRIFKKLDVYNRAQAVSRLKNSHYAHG